MRYPAGKPLRVAHTFYDADEAVVTPASVAYSVTDSLGAVVASGTAVLDGSAYVADLAALPLGEYSAEFSGDGYVESVPIEVTGGVLFTPAEARGFDADLTVARVPPAALRRLRSEIESEFERITERSFVRRARVVPVDCYGQHAEWVGVYDAAALVALYDPDGILVDGTVATIDPDGVLSGLEALPVGTYRAHVEYGHAAVPDDVRRAGLLRLRSVAYEDTSGIPDRAVSFTPTEGGNFTLATAGRGGWETGVPDVDAVLARYRRGVAADVLGVG